MTQQAILTNEQGRALIAKEKRRRTKAPNEDPIQRDIVEHLYAILPADVMVVYTPNEVRGPDQRRARIQQGQLRRLGLCPGYPDLTVIHEQRKVYLEVKAPGGALSKEQRDVRDRLVRWGYHYAVVHSIEEAVAAVRRAGFPLLTEKVR